MRMANENENFDQLKKLLALKKHEVPPPGYFNKLPGEIVSRIRSERAVNTDPMAKLRNEAPWLVRFWQSLEAKPAFAGAFGAAVCAVVLAAIFFAEKPAQQPTFAGPRPAAQPAFASPTTTAGADTLTQGVMLATNPTPNLFDMVPTMQGVPASVNP